MLVLARKLGEELILDDGRIVVKVCKVRGQQVTLGITAAPSVTVDRREVYELRQRTRGTRRRAAN